MKQLEELKCEDRLKKQLKENGKGLDFNILQTEIKERIEQHMVNRASGDSQIVIKSEKLIPFHNLDSASITDYIKRFTLPLCEDIIECASFQDSSESFLLISYNLNK